MTQRELSTLVNEVEQLESERGRIDERAARIGIALLDAYPSDERPELVRLLLDNIDNLV